MLGKAGWGCSVRFLAGFVALAAVSCNSGGGGGGGPTPNDPVTMLFPQAGQKHVPVRPTFQWDRPEPAESFEIFVWTGSAAPSEPTATTTLPNYTPAEALLYGTRYSWRVDAMEQGGSRTAGNVGTFTTIVEATPVLSSAAGEMLSVRPGEKLTFTVDCVDAHDFVTVTARGVPQGATWSDVSQAPAPVQQTFDWTPGGNDVGLYIVTFSAQDAGGLAAEALTTFVSVINPFPQFVALGSLSSTEGVRVEGYRFNAELGYGASGIGDVNGDSFADVAIAAPKEGILDEPGETFVIFGSASLGSGGKIDVELLDGTLGFRIEGRYPIDLFGSSVSGAGDVDGDGLADILVGAPLANGGAGEAYVIFGAPDLGAGGEFSLDGLDGSNGFIMAGSGSNNAGAAVSGAGDVNRDGFADLLIGAPTASPLGRTDGGETYLLFGSPTLGSGGSVDLSTIDAATGVRIMGVHGDDRSGWSVSGAGDVNGDGYADVLIAAPFAEIGGANRSGECYVVFGGPTVGKGGELDLATLDGSDGFALRSSHAEAQLGWSAAGAGNLNADGFDDLVLGAMHFGGDERAEVLVVFGASDLGKGGAVDLDEAFFNGSRGFRAQGIEGQRQIAAAGAGDVNGDGRSDLLVGGPLNDVAAGLETGKAFLVYGVENLGSAGTIDLTTLNGTNGVHFEGAAHGDLAGWSASSAGDTNRDGFGDIVVGAPWANPDSRNDAGVAYVVFGRPSAFIAKAASLDAAGSSSAQGVGIIGDASECDSPATACFVAWDAGSSLSTTDVTLFRARTGLFGKELDRSKLIRAHWQIATDRTGWSKLEVTLLYTDAQAAGINETDLRVLVAPDRDGPWTEIQANPLDPARNRLTVPLTPQDLGFLVISE
ncbi:MAG: integrin alpha [Planctomycetota bacterium]